MDDPRRPPKPRTSPFGHEVPAHVRAQSLGPVDWDGGPITGVHSGPELARARAARPTAERLERLEVKHDDLAKHVGDMRESVGKMAGQLEVLPKLVDAIEKSADRSAQREHVTFTAQVDVDKAGRIATIRDVADAKKARRHLVTKIATGAIALLTSGAALHWLIGKVGS